MERLLLAICMLAGINWSTFWDFSSPTWLWCDADLSHIASWENCLTAGSSLIKDLFIHHFCCIRSQLRPADGPHQLWAHPTAPLNIFCSQANSLQPRNACLCQFPELLTTPCPGIKVTAVSLTDSAGRQDTIRPWIWMGWRCSLWVGERYKTVTPVFPVTNSVICEGWSVLWPFWWLSSTVSLGYTGSCWLCHCNTTEGLQAYK